MTAQELGWCDAGNKVQFECSVCKHNIVGIVISKGMVPPVLCCPKDDCYEDMHFTAHTNTIKPWYTFYRPAKGEWMKLPIELQNQVLNGVLMMGYMNEVIAVFGIPPEKEELLDYYINPN